MQTYNVTYVILISVGLMIGNLVFGLLQDTIVIKKIKRQRRKYFDRRQPLELAAINTKRVLTTDLYKD